MTTYYRDYATYLAELFPGKVQKITLNAGCSCPNRDGSKGTGGCTYCNNASFSPDSSFKIKDIAEQLTAGRQFFARKYRDMKYLAYFQSYTNTHGDRTRLLDMYRQALEPDDVLGLIIGTRPDCVDADLLRDIKRVAGDKPVIMEYGAESSHDTTLNLINRCHSWQDTVRAVQLTAEAGMHCGLHFILGLPGETEDMMLQTIDRVNELPVQTVKFHQLQLIRGTKLARQAAEGQVDVHPYTPDEYIDLCIKLIRRLRPDIAIERFVSQAPDHLLISPRWGLKNYQFTNLLHNRLKLEGLG